ncbi:MAG: hypothetical protein E7Z71_03255 [Methanocorpusculum parvum]|nr:hypothetical protein [Methanocorpusculum parvum]
MKKLAGILLLAAVILTAGCVTTAEPIVGSWQTKEPIQYDDYTLSYQVTFDEDGTGEMTYSYSDEATDNIYPLVWEKTGDTYQYEMFAAFTVSEDGKTMTDYAQYTYRLEKDGEMFGGVWTEDIPEGAEVSEYYTYVFYENGTGVETIYETGEEPDAGPFTWEATEENQISIRYLYTYSFENGKMKTSFGTETVYEEIDGIWVETPQVGGEFTTYEFRDDGICVRSIYDGETKELTGLYTYYYTPVGTNGPLPLLTPLVSLFDMQVGGIMERAVLYELEFLEDGNLQDVVYGEVLERVSPA